MTNDIQTTIPTREALMNPVLAALRDLGGSGTIEEINRHVVESLALSEEQLEIAHLRGRGSEVHYRLAWVRTYLKAYELIDNSARGVWSLTPKGRSVSTVDARAVIQHYNAIQRRLRAAAGIEVLEDVEPEDAAIDWHDEILDALQAMNPSAFERLAQRLLRESGFIQVEVTGRSNDGGIDGRGVLRLNGLLSFYVCFQCKRWQGAVGSQVIREFRGSLAGKADKGLIITTSTFTKEALREATRDGAATIDLVDGLQLAEHLKSLGLGVIIHHEEKVDVDASWFESV